MVTAHENQYYTVPEAARMLRVSPSTVWRWIQAGKLPAYRVGPKSIRIRKEDIEIMIEPVRPKGKAEKAGARTYVGQRISKEELARRQDQVAKILAESERFNIAPLTSADLVHIAREQESHEWKEYVGRVVPQEELARRKAAVAEILAMRKECSIAPLTSAELVRKARRTEMRMYDRGR